MCGITGIFHLETAKPVDPERVRIMTETLVHRGPDGSGVWTAPGVGLGHRRLSIIDLAGGAQPMLSADEKLVVSYNGEIYNFRELRTELEARGHKFSTDSDTEVILHGWRQWGPQCAEHFHGMFALALFDREKQSLFLARDRLGVKPLYYVPLSDGSIAFGSELKALLAHPLLRRRPEQSAVEDFLALGYVPDGNCIVAGVKKLPAGYWLELRRGKSLPKPQRYWDVDFSSRNNGGVQRLEPMLADILKEAVDSRMIADVPLGAFLSGGVDSSSVVALMSETSREPVKTCSIGFDESKLDESAYARMVAQRFGTDHSERIVNPDDFTLIDTLVEHFDEPFADPSALPTYRVSELAREQVTVALSGDGADEAMAGYRRHVFFQGEARARRLIPNPIRRSFIGPLGKLYPKADWAPRPLRAKTTLMALAQSNAQAYAEAVGVTGPEMRGTIYSKDMARALGSHRGEQYFVKAMEGAPARDQLDRAQYADLKVWLPGDILTKVDRMSMAVSLEAREPLLDHRFIEFCATLPTAMRIREGKGKWLLKKAMEKRLPETILYRPKMGFVTPISAWFRGPLADEARRICKGGSLARTGWFDAEALDAVAHDLCKTLHFFQTIIHPILVFIVCTISSR